ncbi:MAG: hypothetical protein ACLFWM_08725 [Actinomycetota bacterium]
MAATPEGRAATEAHRRLQARLATLTVAEMRALWRLLDPQDIDSTVDGWVLASGRLIRQQHDASVQIAERYLTRFRQAEIGQPHTGTLPRPGLSDEAVRTSLLVTGPFRIRKKLGQGGDLADAARTAFLTSTAAATRHALNGGRDLVIGAVNQDRRAVGWARATSARPCAFCALLASRGPVYKTEASATFQPHDACACHPEPVYRDDSEWPGRAREWSDLYSEAAQGQSDPLTTFRRAYEGRTQDTQ